MTAGRLVLFSKNGHSSCTMRETRPIVVKSHILKVVEKAVMLKLKVLNSELLKVGPY